MNPIPVSMPLTEEELEQLEELLASDDVPADCMNMEMLDGYLAAVVAAPGPIPVEVWLPAVWTADGDEAGFGSGAVLQKAIELVLRYQNDLLLAIGDDEADDAWQPFCYAQGGDDDPAIGKEWTAGFEQGFELWSTEWTDTVEDTSIAEALLETLLGDDEEDAVADSAEQLDILEAKGIAVHRLVQTWRALGLAAPEPVVVAAAAGAAPAGPGRNEPCPCGSGKKYKKCCGAT